MTSVGSRGSQTRTWLVRAVVLTTLGLLVYAALAQLPYRWDWQRAWDYRSRFGYGLWITVVVSLASMVVGGVLGVLGCLARMSSWEAVRFVGACYVELVRGTPLLVQLLVAYYCIFPALGYDDPMVVGVIALGLFAGAYITEILRAGIDGVDRGQWEAAAALGFSEWQALRLVIGPQAYRLVIPPLTGQFVSLVKDSSLLSIIAVHEVTKMSELLAASSAKVFEAYLPLALLYLAVTFPLSRLAAYLERRGKARG